MGTIINGNEFSFTSAEIDCAGRTYYGISALNCKDELTPEDVYGNGSVAIGRTEGIYKASADMEIALSEFRSLCAQLGDGFGSRSFNIGVQYRETPGAGLYKIELLGLRLTANDLPNAQGAAGTKVKVTLSLIQPILWNGLTLVKIRKGGLSVSNALAAAAR
jgi:hypothetical protein